MKNFNIPSMCLIVLIIVMTASFAQAASSTTMVPKGSIPANATVTSFVSTKSVMQSVNNVQNQAAGDSLTTIDFEGLPEYTLVSNQYQEQGVVFSGNPNILTKGGRLNTPGYPPRSGVNVLNGIGGTKVIFNSPVSSFNFYYWAVNALTVSVYDVNNKLIQTVTGNSDTTGYAHGPTMLNLAASSEQGISYIVIGGASNYFAIDDFSFSGSPSVASIKIVSPTTGYKSYINATPTPTMPIINFEARSTGGTPTSISWQGVLSDSWTTRNVKTGKTSPASKTLTFNGNNIGNTWTPNFGNNIMGGDMKVTVTAIIKGKQYQDVITVHILGKNPDNKIAIKNLLGATEYQVLAYVESTLRQFGNSGTPLFGPPAGYGLMQLDPVSSYAERWNWVDNANAGIAHFNGNLAFARGLQAKVSNYYKGKQKVSALTKDQILTQAFYAYNAGNPSSNGMKNTFYIWDITKQKWVQNPSATKAGVTYANKCMSIYKAVNGGHPPSGWK